MGSRRHLHLHTNNKISASFFVMCDRVDFYEYQCFFMALPNFHFSKSSYFLPFSAPPLPPQPLVLFSPFLTFLLISVGIIGTFFHLPSPRHFPHRKTFTLPCYFSISNSFRLYHNHHFSLFIPLQTNIFSIWSAIGQKPHSSYLRSYPSVCCVLHCSPILIQ